MSEWRAGWKKLIAAAIGAGMYSFHAYSLGSMMGPLSRDLGWSRATIAGALLACVSGAMFAAPVAGALVDRYGTRRVALPSIWIYGFTLAAIGLCPPHAWAWIVAWVMAGILFSGASTVIWTRAVAMEFDRHRGFALALTLSGAGVAYSAIPWTAVTLEAAFGWRMTYALLGLIAIAVAFPVNWWLLRDRTPIPTSAVVAAPVLAGMTLREALGTSVFWRLAAALSAVSAAIGTLMVHGQSIMIGAGLSAIEAAGFAALFGPALIVGRLVGGYLVDHVDPRFVAAVSFLFAAAACLLLRDYDGSTFRSIASPIATGIAAGVEADLVAFLCSRYFGMRRYGAIFGVLFGFFGVGTSLTPVIVGRIYDVSGSYAAALLFCAIISILAALLILTLGRPPRHAADEPADSLPSSSGVPT